MLGSLCLQVLPLGGVALRVAYMVQNFMGSDAIDELVAFWTDQTKTPHQCDQEVIRGFPRVQNSREAVAELGLGFDYRGCEIHPDFRPVPYLGDLKTAKVVLLMLNPSATLADYLAHKDVRFENRLHSTICQKKASPCLALDMENFGWTGWFQWYENQLRGSLIDAARQTQKPYSDVLRSLSEKTAILELVPYYANNGSQFPARFVQDLPSAKKARAAAKYLIDNADKDDRLVILWWAQRKWELDEEPEKAPHFFKLQGRGQADRTAAFSALSKKITSWFP